MKKIATFIVAYSFVIITALQLVVNLVFIFFKDFYLQNWFMLANLFGFSFLYLIPMVSVAFLFKFCAMSRICAIAQVILSLLWLIIQEDNVYNITAQVIIGGLSLALTFKKIKL